MEFGVIMDRSTAAMTSVSISFGLHDLSLKSSSRGVYTSTDLYDYDCSIFDSRDVLCRCQIGLFRLI
jgi:hypothetical protein